MLIPLAVLVGLMLTFWGSGVGPHGPRLMLFGLITLYEEPLRLWGPHELWDMVRQEVLRQLPPADSAEPLEEEIEEDASDERDLWERCEDAGFTTIDDDRDLRLTDVSCIDWSNTNYECVYCNGKVYRLWELYQPDSPSPNLVERVRSNPLGYVCVSCGCRTLIDEVTMPVGVIGPVIGPGANFFDVLAHFEALRKPKTEPVTEPVADAPVEPAPAEPVPEQHPDPIGTALASAGTVDSGGS